MKLIIDIPKEIVIAIQNGQDYRYDIHTAIAQGTEVSTDGDLISREALKKHITEIVETEEKIDKKWATGLKYSLKLIDNALAINPVCWNCVHFGEKYAEGHCIKCRDKDMWEVKNE